jgi:hypothetical protein
MVLKHYSYENTQNTKSSFNSTSKLKLANNRYINTPNASYTRTLNSHSGKKERDCPNNTRSSNSNKTNPLLIYH